jgi:hypothetical protein
MPHGCAFLRRAAARKGVSNCERCQEARRVRLASVMLFGMVPTASAQEQEGLVNVKVGESSSWARGSPKIALMASPMYFSRCRRGAPEPFASS